MSKVRFSLRAAQDLEEVEGYISRDNPDAAARLIQTFYRPAHDGIEVVRVLHGARDVPKMFK